MVSGVSGEVAMAVTQPLCPLRVPRRASVSMVAKSVEKGRERGFF